MHDGSEEAREGSCRARAMRVARCTRFSADHDGQRRRARSKTRRAASSLARRSCSSARRRARSRRPRSRTRAGDYVFPNVTADTYTVEVTMEGFKTLTRKGVRVSGGDRVAVPTMTIEVGGAAETVNVAAEAALVQSQSGERSFAVDDRAGREPADRPRQLHQPRSAFAPGVISGGASAGATRLGGVSQNNIMMDGVSAMDTGNNGQMLNMNIESIGEVKILTQGYQAEYGRSSGLQITAVTKSGTNQFRGSAYDIQTDSDWNANSWVRDQNGDAKPKTDQKASDTPSAVRSASPAAPTSCSSSMRTSIVRRQPRSTAATPSVCGCRPRSSGRATSRRASTTTATPIPQLLDPVTRQPFPSNTIPADQLYALGADDPQPVSAPERHADHGHQLQLRDPEQRAADDGRSDPAAGHPARLPDVTRSCASPASTPASGRGSSRRPASSRASPTS